MRKPFVIAEIGINHNGDLDLAKMLIDAKADVNYANEVFPCLDVPAIVVCVRCFLGSHNVCRC